VWSISRISLRASGKALSPRWERRLRIILDWTIELFFKPDITKVELRPERDMIRASVANVRR